MPACGRDRGSSMALCRSRCRKDIGPEPPLAYHHCSNWSLGRFLQFINRAKDELVTSHDFDAFVDASWRFPVAARRASSADAERPWACGGLSLGQRLVDWGLVLDDG